MSYTPTTEEVRDAAVEYFGWESPDPEAAFDRWLAALIREAKAEAWDECDERITNHIHDTAGAMSARTVVMWPKNPYREGSET